MSQQSAIRLSEAYAEVFKTLSARKTPKCQSPLKSTLSRERIIKEDYRERLEHVEDRDRKLSIREAKIYDREMAVAKREVEVRDKLSSLSEREVNVAIQESLISDREIEVNELFKKLNHQQQQLQQQAEQQELQQTQQVQKQQNSNNIERLQVIPAADLLIASDPPDVEIIVSGEVEAVPPPPYQQTDTQTDTSDDELAPPPTLYARGAVATSFSGRTSERTTAALKNMKSIPQITLLDAVDESEFESYSPTTEQPTPQQPALMMLPQVDYFESVDEPALTPPIAPSNKPPNFSLEEGSLVESRSTLLQSLAEEEFPSDPPIEGEQVGSKSLD